MKRALLMVLCTVVILLATAHSTTATANASGQVLYVDESGNSIRLIAPDGSNDRLVWTVPSPDLYDIWDIDLSPDGTTIAVSATHEHLCSIYRSDIYLMNTAGTDVRRLTNSPDCNGLAAFPTGRVDVTFQNLFSDLALFVVYVEGAPATQLVSIPPGTNRTVTFLDVADFGPGRLQRIVAINGETTYYSVGVWADVLAGETVTSNNLLELSNATDWERLGAHVIDWHPSGNKIGFAMNYGLWEINTIPPQAGYSGTTIDLASGILTKQWVWSPDGAQVAYAALDGSGIYIAEVGGTPPERVIENGATHLNFRGLDWLPDGSGIIFSYEDGYPSYDSVYVYTFATTELVKITDFTNRYVGQLAISPDGTQIVYETNTSAVAAPDLYRMNIDGSGQQSLGVRGYRPRWGPTAAPTALEFATVQTATSAMPDSSEVIVAAVVVAMVVLILLVPGIARRRSIATTR